MEPAPATGENHAVILGEAEAYKIYLTEKVRRREMTPAEADARERLYGGYGAGKIWLSPVHDGIGAIKTAKSIADEMGSWWGKIYFKKYGGKTFVILKGYAGLRPTIKGTRYKLTNPKFATWQIAHKDVVKGARESARIGVWIVCAIDVLDFFFRDTATLGELFGHLAVDIPSVVIAAAAGALTEMAIVGGAALLGVSVVAVGPVIVGVAVAAFVGYELGNLDEKYQISKKLGDKMDEALKNLKQARNDLRRELRENAEAVLHEIDRARAVFNLLHDVDRLWRDMSSGWPQLPRWRMLPL